MMHWILFIYLSSFSTQGGMTMATAEFATEQSCQDAGEQVKKEFKTFFIQPIKAICVSNGEQAKTEAGK